MKFRWPEPPKTKTGNWEKESQMLSTPSSPTRKLVAAIQLPARFPDRVTYQPMRREPFYRECQLESIR